MLALGIGVWSFFCLKILDHHYGLPFWLAFFLLCFGMIPILLIDGVCQDERTVTDGPASNPTDGADEASESEVDASEN